MVENGQATKIIAILEKQSSLLDEILIRQAEIRISVTKRDWQGLQECISRIQVLSERFIDLENTRVRVSDGQKLSSIPEAVPVVTEVRNKLVKSKVENKALGDYVSITRGFLQSVLDTVVPQRRNTLYSRKGNIVKPQPESVVLDKLF